MSATILNGKALAADLQSQIKNAVSGLKSQGVTPGLAVVLVGEDPASASYVTAKEKACEENGLHSRDLRLKADTPQAELEALIHQLNQDPEIHGILIQLPLPPHLDQKYLLSLVSPEKDVDGFHPISIGKMMLGEDTFLPCTPHGILKLLEVSGVKTPGARVVVLGRSNIVGKPVAVMLMQAPYHCTVTVCHTKTKDLKAHTREADILIAAVGRPHTLTKDMVKPGAVVIDVGVNRVEDPSAKKGYRLVGDADTDDLLEVAQAITPVPGGVGPMTITMLLYNTVKSACRARKIPFLLEES